MLAGDQREEGTGDKAQYTTGTPVFNSLLPDQSMNGYCIDDARTFKIQLSPKGQAIATPALNDGFRGWNFRARAQELFFSAVHLDSKPWFLQFVSHLSGFME